MMRALQAIVFDFDGVIADSEALHLRAYREVLAPLGLGLPAEEYYQEYLGYDDWGVLERYARARGLAWDEAIISRLVNRKEHRYEALSAQGVMVFPGAAAFIRDAAAVVPIGVASAARTGEIEDVLERADLKHYFGAIVGADRVHRSKPAPDTYLEAFMILSASAGTPIERDRTVAIEDSSLGLESARAAGLRLVGVTNTHPASVLASVAELVVSGLDGLTLTALDVLCEARPSSERTLRSARP